MTELASRGDSLGFAARTKKNLLYIEQAYRGAQDVHLVTQIVLSCLGLIVFPWEQGADRGIRGARLQDLEKSRWPVWQEIGIQSEGLGELIRKLRNAIAHRNVRFSSDDREPRKVAVTFGSENKDWECTISADGLKRFCLLFIELVENTIG